MSEVNKVIYGDETLIDLTNDTVNENNVLEGATFHASDGTIKTGGVVVADVIDDLTSASTTDALSANQGRLLDYKMDNLFTYMDLSFSIPTSAVGVSRTTVNFTKPSGYRFFNAIITSFNNPHVAIPTIVSLSDNSVTINLYTTFGGSTTNSGNVRVLFIKE